MLHEERRGKVDKAGRSELNMGRGLRSRKRARAWSRVFLKLYGFLYIANTFSSSRPTRLIARFMQSYLLLFYHFLLKVSSI